MAWSTSPVGLRKWLYGLGRLRLGAVPEQTITLEQKNYKVQEKVKSTFLEVIP